MGCRYIDRVPNQTLFVRLQKIQAKVERRGRFGYRATETVCGGENPICHMGVSKNREPQNGWFIMENPIKMDDLGVPLFLNGPCRYIFAHMNSWLIFLWDLNM